MASNSDEGGATQIEIVSSSNPSTTPTQIETSTAIINNSNTGEILYKGAPVFSWFDKNRYSDLIGEPLDRFGAGGTGLGYDYGGMIIYEDLGKVLSVVTDDPSVFSVDGVTLDKDREGIIEIFGNPAREWDDWGYGMVYQFGDLEMYVSMNSPDEKAFEILIKPSDDLGDGENYPDGSGSWRDEYFTGISYTDLMRYPDQHIGDKVHFVQMTVTQIVQQKYYVAFWGNDRYFIIDDRGNDQCQQAKLANNVIEIK